MLPFTTEQFIGIFERYNNDLPWAGVMLAAGALAALILSFRFRSRRIVPIALAMLWLWAGAVYHIGYFSEINQGAYIFGAVFVLQSILLLRNAFASGIEIRNGGRLIFAVGLFLAAFAILIYPVIGIALGHTFPRSPLFGVPCPLVIFTFGVFVMNPRPTSFYLLVIPLFWALVGTSAAFLLGMWEDLSLSPAAVILLWAEIAKRRAERQHCS